MNYRVYSFSGYPILAVPESSRQFRLQAWKHYQPLTIKRAIVQRSMTLLTWLNLDGVICQRYKNLLEVNAIPDFQGWLEQVRLEIGSSSIQPVLIWPPQTDRGRVYVHLLDKMGQSVGFAKISLDGRNDKHLNAESQKLRELTQRQFKTFHVPGVISQGIWRGHVYIIQQPLSSKAQPYPVNLVSYPQKCIDELAGLTHMAMPQELQTYFWWRCFDRPTNKTLDSFRNELKRLIKAKGGLPVCHIHGDFGPANIMCENDNLWIFDWEESTAHGPLLADKIGYDMAVHSRELKKHPEQILQSFFERHLRGADSEARRDVMAALAFRYKFAPTTTQLYIEKWAEINVS